LPYGKPAACRSGTDPKRSGLLRSVTAIEAGPGPCIGCSAYLIPWHHRRPMTSLRRGGDDAI
jgi:hypothetical protein